MRSIIVGMAGCSKCKTLKASSPDAEYVEVQPAEILALARALNIQSMPFVVCVGETNELEKIFKE